MAASISQGLSREQCALLSDFYLLLWKKVSLQFNLPATPESRPFEDSEITRRLKDISERLKIADLPESVAADVISDYRNVLSASEVPAESYVRHLRDRGLEFAGAAYEGMQISRATHRV